MLTSHELFGFMSPELSGQILEAAHDGNKELYRSLLATVAESRKLRPQFFERTPRTTRHVAMAQSLSKPRLEMMASNLLRDWLMKHRVAMLSDFMDGLGVAHKDGAVDELPAAVDEAKLRSAIDTLLAKHPPEEVAVYLNAFVSMNDPRWPALESMLKTDPRLQFGA